jgi:predicted ferric reductase
MGKRILSVIAGIVTGVVTVFIFDTISQKLFPFSAEGVDFKNPEAIKEFMSHTPMGFKIAMYLGWILSAFLAAFVASKISSENWKQSSIIIGSVLMFGAILNLISIPHPVWMWSAILLYIPMAFLGGKFASK